MQPTLCYFPALAQCGEKHIAEIQQPNTAPLYHVDVRSWSGCKTSGPDKWGEEYFSLLLLQKSRLREEEETTPLRRDRYQQ